VDSLSFPCCTPGPYSQASHREAFASFSAISGDHNSLIRKKLYSSLFLAPQSHTPLLQTPERPEAKVRVTVSFTDLRRNAGQANVLRVKHSHLTDA
jgi:hypothetical protein